MSSAGSVTAWIGRLKAGEDSALARLHARYWPLLVALARRRLHDLPSRAADEEDVAQDAFWGFYRELQDGKVPRLENRQQFLALLSLIVARKAHNLMRSERAEKRGGGRVQGELVLDHVAQDPAATPLQETILADCYQYYLNGLPDKLRRFAELFLAGCTHQEIADQLGCVERTVERKLSLILERWQALAADE